MSDDSKLNEDYRRVLSTAKKLDTIQSNLESVIDFFITPNIVKLQASLCNDCLKILFECEFKLDHCRKAEELIWKRIYHDLYRFQKAKKLIVNREDECLLESHFISGIGFYSSLIVRLRSHYKIRDVPGVLEPLNLSLGPIDNFVDDQRLNEEGDLYRRTTKSNDQYDFDGDEDNLMLDAAASNKRVAKEWAHNAIYRSLVYMGDLARYLQETSYINYKRLAFEFYRSASRFQPDHGLPFNQLATLAASLNHNLGAVCNYMRCCLRPKPFEGAEGNMKQIFELNDLYYEEERKEAVIYTSSEVLASKDPSTAAETMMRSIVVSFIKLVSDLWLSSSSSCNETNRDRIIEETKIFFEGLREALELEPIVPFANPAQVEHEFCPITGGSSHIEKPRYVTPTIMYDFCSISIMLIAKCQKEQTSGANSSLELVNTLALNLLHYSTSKCQLMVMRKLQEYRLGHSTESPFAFIYNQTYLTTIKIYCDWLLSNGPIVRSNLESFRAFSLELDNLVSFLQDLTLLSQEEVSKHYFNGPMWIQKYPLSCDFPLFKVGPLKEVHESNINFKEKGLNEHESGFIATQCVIAFSHALTICLKNKDFR